MRRRTFLRLLGVAVTGAAVTPALADATTGPCCPHHTGGRSFYWDTHAHSWRWSDLRDDYAEKKARIEQSKRDDWWNNVATGEALSAEDFKRAIADINKRYPHA